MPLVRSRMTEKPSSLVQAASGGALMGLANLVPGVSGGTMLLVTGIYTEFITAIADVSRLRWRASSLLFLSAVVGAAAGAIILLAGPTKTLVIEQRWIMYSLFIGLTLGGVPLIWRLAQPVFQSFFVGAGMAFALMVLLALGNTSPDHENLDSRETKRANCTVEDERGAGKQTIDGPCWHTYDARQDGGRCEPSIWEMSVQSIVRRLERK